MGMFLFFKTCVDCFYSLGFSNVIRQVAHSFLDHANTPLYEFYGNQLYFKVDEYWLVKEKDHTDVIG